MNEIGRELSGIVGGDPDGVFLYVEISNNWMSYSVFKDEGYFIRQYDDEASGLHDLIRKAWRTEESDAKIMRWSVMEYAVEGEKFDAVYRYPEEVDVERFDDGRRAAALHKRYGDKPVMYTPLRVGEEERTS